MELTENFKLSEFDCKDGTKVPKEYLDNVKICAINLQRIRNELNEPLYITSAYRTLKHNTDVGGAKYSKHLKALAVDFQTKDKDIIKILCKMIELMAVNKIKKGFIKVYDSFIHYEPNSDFKIKINLKTQDKI